MVAHHLMLAHDPWLVGLSLLIAAQGSYVSLLLADQVDRTVGLHRRLALAAAAMTLAVSIWSMHFVGMLAARFPVTVEFLILPTLISLLICILMVGAGVLIVHAPLPRALRIGGGALAMGTGVTVMHYVGMSAIDMAGHMHHSLGYVVGAAVIAVAASALALWQIERPMVAASRMASAIILGLAISGMHYTAMAGMSVMPDAVGGAGTALPSLSHDVMAMTVVVVSFLISGGFLVSLMPERVPAAASALAPAGPLAPLHHRQIPPQVPHSAVRGSTAPQLSPVAIPPPEGDGTEPIASGTISPPAPPSGWPAFASEIEVEKDGHRRALPVGAIVFVRANARYTYISDGAHEFFCPSTIGEVEALLDPACFMRVHRSYIVSLPHVEAVRRVGDAGAAEIDAAVQRSIPVARARFSSLKQRVQATKA
ncbi:MHYT domain-containing protein [Azorhizobium sp. AG788]|uniref:MHYT domain-containing protein n=1 Tax=Azorhizobium sp. AG788 TaxID=2183897 RepID=UPI00313905D2